MNHYQSRFGNEKLDFKTFSTSVKFSARILVGTIKSVITEKPEVEQRDVNIKSTTLKRKFQTKRILMQN